jgi:hypothetical protein
MKQIRSFIIVLTLVGIGLGVHNALSYAQNVLLAPYNIAPTLPPISKDRCSYFVWNDVTGTVRTGFYYYVTPGQNSGAKEEENPTFDQIAVFLGDNDLPTAQKVGTEEHPLPIWKLVMSNATYVANQRCLPKPEPIPPPATH